MPPSKAEILAQYLVDARLPAWTALLGAVDDIAVQPQRDLTLGRRLLRPPLPGSALRQQRHKFRRQDLGRRLHQADILGGQFTDLPRLIGQWFPVHIFGPHAGWPCEK